MSETSSQRLTRSASNPNNAPTLSDVKSWIESSESKILSSLRSDLDHITGILESLSRRVENIEQKNVALEKRYEELVKENSKLSEELSKMRDMSTSSKLEILEESVAESQNRMSRIQNIVLQGVPESDTGSVDDRMRQDTERVNEVLREIGVSDTAISNVRRVGRKRKDGSRLLLVRVADVDGKRRILAKSKTLRNSSSMSRVFVKPDLTPMQQAHDRRLRDELRDRRAKGEDVVIFRGHIRARSDLQNFH